MAEEMRQSGDPAAVRAVPGRDVATDPAARRPVPKGWDEPVALDRDPGVIPDIADLEVPDGLKATIEGHMAKYPDRHSAALPALGAAQDVYGWCSPRAIAEVAAVMQVTPAYLASVATFYDMLRTEPTGSRYVYVCTSVACHLRNSKRVYDAVIREAWDQELLGVEIREFECLGACDMAPMASVDGRYIGPLESADAAELVRQIKAGETVLPGRGLGDPEFRLPWDGTAAQSAGPEAHQGDDEPAGEPEGEPVHPTVHPAGGTWKDMEAEKVEGPRHDVTPAEPPRQSDPGTMHGGKDDRP
jgi:NADH:ubiquinone oxidoreductase subunit E